MTISQINPVQLRPPDDESGWHIIQVAADRRAEAIERLLAVAGAASREHTRRFLEYAASHRIDLEGLWSLVDDLGRIQATVLAVPSPGRTSMVFCSRGTTAAVRGRLPGLIDHACLGLTETSISLAQVLLDPEEVVERETFEAAGFLRLAVLTYLERSIPRSRSIVVRPQWPQAVTIHPYHDALKNDLMSILEASYEDTLDCPGLQGLRRPADILDGHRAAGSFDPALWTLVRVNEVWGGALLLNPAADRQSVELVYLGLAKWARGFGLGTQLLRHGLAQLAGRSEKVITLAVDENNAPALKLYRREGFRPALRRVAMIRRLSTNASRVQP